LKETGISAEKRLGVVWGSNPSRQRDRRVPYRCAMPSGPVGKSEIRLRSESMNKSYPIKVLSTMDEIELIFA
jgi:hypothetical protein